jgi:hypothetical protein
VIPFPEDGVWTFWDFVSLDGSNPIDDWYQSLSEEAMSSFDALLKANQKIKLQIHWLGFKGFLKGAKLQDERIWELQFSADKRQYRVLGKFGDVRKQVILLVGCYHKGNVYTPPDALDLAPKRAKALREGKARIYERKVNNDI